MLVKNFFITIRNIDYHCLTYTFNKENNTSLWIIMMHQGLGSIPQWKLFPEIIFNKLKLSVLLYERTGYGNTGTIKDELPENFLYYEAYEILPQIINKCKIKDYYLIGHSDGATISLLFASLNPKGLLGLCAIAPHVFIEDITLKGIKKLVQDYNKGILKYFLQKYHYEKTDLLFNKWSNFWLNETMLSWNIFKELNKINVKVLTIQGSLDEFGTEKQLEFIAKHCPSKTEHYIIDNCRHNPHLEYPTIVIDKINNLLK